MRTQSLQVVHVIFTALVSFDHLDWQILLGPERVVSFEMYIVAGTCIIFILVH